MSIDDLAWGESGLLPVIVQDAATGAVLTLAYADREALRRTLAERQTWLFSRSRRALWKKGETSGNTQAVASIAFDCDADALLYRVHPSGPACHTGAPSCFAQALLAPHDDAPHTASPPEAGAPAASPSDGGSHDAAPADVKPAAPADAAPHDAPADAGPHDTPADAGPHDAPADVGPVTFERAVEHLRATIAARRGASPETSYTAKLLHGGVDRIGKKIGEEATEVVIAAKNADAAEIAWEVADLFYHTLVLLEERGVALDAVGAELLRRAT